MKEIIADRTKLIDASGIRKVFALAAELKDPVNFSRGLIVPVLPSGPKISVSEGLSLSIPANVIARELVTTPG